MALLTSAALLGATSAAHAGFLLALPSQPLPVGGQAPVDCPEAAAGRACPAVVAETLLATRVILAESARAAARAGRDVLPTAFGSAAAARAALVDPARWQARALAGLPAAFGLPAGGAPVAAAMLAQTTGSAVANDPALPILNAPPSGAPDARVFTPSDFVGPSAIALALLETEPLDLAAVRDGIAISATPVPATALLLVVGVGLLLLPDWQRRRGARAPRRLAAGMAVLLSCACTPAPTPEAQLAQAEARLDAGDLPAAAAMLRELLATSPETTYARWLYATLNARLGDWPAAEREYRRALALGMSPNAALVPLAWAMLMQGQATALLQFEPAGALMPDAAASLAALQALAALMQGAPNDAAAQLQTARRTGRAGVFADLAEARLSAASGRLAEARAGLDAALLRHPESGAAWHLCGELALAAGDQARADTCFAAAVALGPWQPEWLYERALGLLGQGLILAAEPYLERLLLTTPRSAPTNYALGRYLLARGDPRTASGHFEVALAARPDHVETLYYLAEAQFTLGAAATAEGYLHRAIDLAPTALAPRRRLAEHLLEQGRFAQAALVLRPALAAEPADPAAVVLYAGAAIGLGRAGDAVEALAALVQQAPAVPLYRERLALAYLATGELPAAIGALDLATDLDPTLLVGERRLLDALLGQGALDKALARAQRLLARLPDAPEALLALAEVYAARGDVAAARQVLTGVPTGTPARREAVRLLVWLALAEAPGGVGAPTDAADVRALLAGQIAADPADADAMLMLADLLNAAAPGPAPAAAGAALDGPDDAGYWLRAAVAVAPARPDLRLALARFLLAQGRAREVITLLAPDLADNPDMAPLLLVQAAALLVDGQPEAAWDLARRAGALAPDDLAVGYLLARAELALGRKQEAIATLSALLAQAPDLLPARRDLVTLLIAQGDWARAASALPPLLAARPADAGVALLAGQVAVGQGRREAALAYLQQAVAGGAGRGALLAQGRLREQLGQSAEAIASYRGWLARAPKDRAVRHALAAALVQADDSPAGVAEWRVLLADDAGDVPALNNLANALLASAPGEALALAERAASLALDEPAVADTWAAAQAANGQSALAVRTLARALAQHPEAHALRLREAHLLLAADQVGAAIAALEPMLVLPPTTPGWAEAIALLARLQEAD